MRIANFFHSDRDRIGFDIDDAYANARMAYQFVLKSLMIKK